MDCWLESSPLGERALRILDGIVDGITDHERRRVFLSLPEVERLRAG